ncbi:MAG TPA: acyltransferase [Pyrinomonadaceae bacterium]|nr:acyltransferase [Pyrinomonadaceae bacterium]
MSSSNPPTLSNGRLQSIDALRGIAALCVVLYHGVLQTQNSVPANIFQWPVKGVVFLSSLGYIGVFLFFVISGFCIHLQWAKSQIGNPQPIRFGAFWKRRIRRLYPPYLIAIFLFLAMAAFSVGIDVTHFFVYDVVMHLLMLHNLDPHTCYSINGVFWTLAIEEQLYLAYFLLLYLRKRWGWGVTLLTCAMARVGWFFLSHAVWLTTGYGLPVPEAAASHWFTWALGALAVEAAVGLVELPKWCRNIWLCLITIVGASAISLTLPYIQKDTLLHDGAWMLMHPLWGFGFFVVVNRAVNAERNWIERLRQPRLVTLAAALGVFSYSLYLTHELVIMQSWRLAIHSLPPILNTLLVITPATIGFAWLYYRFCEKPYMRKPATKPSEQRVEEPTPVFNSNVSIATEEA